MSDWSTDPFREPPELRRSTTTPIQSGGNPPDRRAFYDSDKAQRQARETGAARAREKADLAADTMQIWARLKWLVEMNVGEWKLWIVDKSTFSVEDYNNLAATDIGKQIVATVTKMKKMTTYGQELKQVEDELRVERVEVNRIMTSQMPDDKIMSNNQASSILKVIDNCLEQLPALRKGTAPIAPTQTLEAWKKPAKPPPVVGWSLENSKKGVYGDVNVMATKRTTTDMLSSMRACLEQDGFNGT